MRYFANYEADAVIREDDNGRRYIKRLNNLQTNLLTVGQQILISP